MNPQIEAIIMNGYEPRQRTQIKKQPGKPIQIDSISKATEGSPIAYLNAAGKLAGSTDPDDQAECRALARQAMIAAEHMGVREAWHLHGIGLSPAVWVAKTGQTYEAARALYEIEKLAAKRRAGNEVRWNDPALISARIHATAAAERHGVRMKPKHLKGVLGISHADWIDATGTLFRRVDGAFKEIGQAVIHGKEMPIRSFRLKKPIKVDVVSAYG